MADLSRITKKYSNGEVTIIWKPSLCIHSANCFNGLPQVFKPANRPWIDPQGAGTDEIINQVSNCPSKALSYFMNSEGEKTSAENINETAETETIVEAKPNGPLFIYGNITVKKSDGSEENRKNVTAFCRCGNSGNKPYCDGSHIKTGFKR